MIVSLPSGLHADLGQDSQMLSVCQEIFYNECYGSLHLNQDDNLLDCGANIGLFTISAARKVRSVVSVEPSSTNFSLLKKNVVLNSLENVRLVKKAIFNSHDKMLLHGHGSGANFFTDCPATEEVECTTIDDLKGNFSVLKIDVEMSEIQALEGATRTLEKVRELVLEYHTRILREKAVELLEGHGFTVTEPHLHHGLAWFEGFVLLNLRQASRKRMPNLLRRAGLKKETENNLWKRGVLHASRK